MRIFKTFKFVFLLFLLYSCSNENETNLSNHTTQQSINSYKVSAQEARVIAVNFAKVFKATDGKKSRNTVSISAKDVNVVNVNRSSTRSISYGFPIPDTLLYAVNLSNNNGYVLVSADKRASQILGIIDKGEYDENDIKTNHNYAYFLNLALGQIIGEIKSYKDTIRLKTRSLDDYTVLIPNLAFNRLSTNWGQNSPYNIFCPGKYTGCVATAAAQILSKYMTPTHVSWRDNNLSGSSDIHWSQVLSDCRKNNGRLNQSDSPLSSIEIAHLMRYLGVVLDAKYSNDGTSIKSSKAIDWFNNISGLKATSLKDYNITDIHNAIGLTSLTNIVYMRGNSGRKKFLGITISYTGGHAWICDVGTTVIQKSTNQFIPLFHFNWGWDGQNNGFFLAKVFDSRNPAIGDWEYDTGGQNPNTSNFKYHVQYSIISDSHSFPNLIVK